MNSPKRLFILGIAFSLLLSDPAPGAEGGPAAGPVAPLGGVSVESRIVNSEWVEDGGGAVWSFKEGGEWSSKHKGKHWTGKWKVTGPHEAIVHETNGNVFVYRFDDQFTTVARFSTQNPSKKVHAVRKKA